MNKRLVIFFSIILQQYFSTIYSLLKMGGRSPLDLFPLNHPLPFTLNTTDVIIYLFMSCDSSE